MKQPKSIIRRKERKTQSKFEGRNSIETDKITNMKPNKFYYHVAKEYLKLAYSEKVAKSFFGFEIKKAKGKVKVQCSNGGAFITLSFVDDAIWRSGDYAKCRKVNTRALIEKFINDIENIPTYYSVKFGNNIDCYQRCVSDIEKSKQDVLSYWLHTYGRPLEEPINWIIKEV